jgi:hypothetical protein
MKKINALLALVLMAGMLLAACGPAVTTTVVAPAATDTTAAVAPAATNTPAPVATDTPAAKKLKVGLVTDTGGVNDKSFNQSAWTGVQKAAAEFGFDAKFIESKQQTDYEKNIDQFATEGYDVIVTVGFLMGDATAAKAKQYPNIKFAIIDNAYFPTKGSAACSDAVKDCYVRWRPDQRHQPDVPGRPGRFPGGRARGRHEQDRHRLHSFRHGNPARRALRSPVSRTAPSGPRLAPRRSTSTSPPLLTRPRARRPA